MNCRCCMHDMRRIMLADLPLSIKVSSHQNHILFKAAWLYQRTPFGYVLAPINIERSCELLWQPFQVMMRTTSKQLQRPHKHCMPARTTGQITCRQDRKTLLLDQQNISCSWQNNITGSNCTMGGALLPQHVAAAVTVTVTVPQAHEHVLQLRAFVMNWLYNPHMQPQRCSKHCSLARPQVACKQCGVCTHCRWTISLHVF